MQGGVVSSAYRHNRPYLLPGQSSVCLAESPPQVVWLAVQKAVAEAEESGPDILTAVTLSVVEGSREQEVKIS